MNRSIFGWSYPPGAATDPNAPYNQTDDGPCEVCGQALDECICPECPTCDSVGDPACYDGALRCSWCGITTHKRREGCISCTSIPVERTFTDEPPHGLVRSFAQVALRAQAEEQWAADEADYDYADESTTALRSWLLYEQHD